MFVELNYYSALELNVNKDIPGGALRPFCAAAMATSIFHLSTNNGSVASDITESINNKQLCLKDEINNSLFFSEGNCLVVKVKKTAF